MLTYALAVLAVCATPRRPCCSGQANRQGPATAEPQPQAHLAHQPVRSGGTLAVIAAALTWTFTQRPPRSPARTAPDAPKEPERPSTTSTHTSASW